MSKNIKLATVSGVDSVNGTVSVVSNGNAMGYLPCISNQESMPYDVGDKVYVMDEVVIGKMYQPS